MSLGKDTAQKKKELEWLLAFQARCSDCPRSAPEQREPPAPDIIFPNKGLGIELTQYLLDQGKNGSYPHRLERVREQIVREAQSEYESSNSECLQVSVFWANEQCPKNEEREFISHCLAQLVRTRPEKSRCINWEQFKNPTLENYIEEVRVDHLISDKSQSCWSSSAALWLGEAGKRAQVALDEKEPKVSQYRKFSQEVWLLIVAQRSWLSSRFFRDPPPQPTLYSSFDRVFLLDEASSCVEEFKVERKR